MIDILPSLTLMGAWDNFYENSVIDENISTHYLSLPHYCILEEMPSLYIDHQHNDLKWFGLDEVTVTNNFHEYMQSYASWLIKMDKKND